MFGTSNGGNDCAKWICIADDFLFQWVDTVEGKLYGDTYKNGVLIQHAFVGAENYPSSYGFQWNGSGATLTSDIDVAFNIYDPNSGVLSDTWHLFGTAGSGFLAIPFSSDIEGQTLTPLANAFSIDETGGFQTVLTNTLANGDTFTWQFASGVDSHPVPEPSTFALLGLGSIGLAIGAYRRRRIAV